MQDRMEIDRNPTLDFPMPGGENEAEPTRASSRPASKKKSNLTLTYDEVAKLKGVEFATELFALKEAASTYHPSPESVRAAMQVLRERTEQPTEAVMRLAGPALVTYMRDPARRTRDAFRAWLKATYPKEYERHAIVVHRRNIAPQPPNPYGILRRVSYEQQAKFKADGKRWCPGCTQPKPIAEFQHNKGTIASRCKNCRRTRVIEEVKV